MLPTVLSSKCTGPTMNCICTKHNLFLVDFMVCITLPYPNAHYDKNLVYNEECQGWGFSRLLPFDLYKWEYTNPSRLRWEWSVNGKHKIPLISLLMVIVANKTNIYCIHVQWITTTSTPMGLKNCTSDIGVEWECKRNSYRNAIKNR